MTTSRQVALLRRRSASAPAFSPSSLSPLLWLEARDLSSMFQTITGTTAVSADGDVVGTWKDKSGNGFDLTATANDTTRPVYHTGSGLRWVLSDGSDDILRRNADLGMYSAGACSAYAAVRGNPGTSTSLFAARRSSDGNPIYTPLTNVLAPLGATEQCFLLRNDASSFMVAISSTEVPNAYDNTDNVVAIEDSGTVVTNYLDGTLVATSSGYSRSGSTVTLDRTSLFGSFTGGSGSENFLARVYGLVVVGRTLTSLERSNLVTYMGALMGRSL